MPSNRINVLTANLYHLAAKTYNDTTTFVQIMQQNGLDDILINKPVIVDLAAAARAGTYVLTLPHTEGIKVGWIVSSDQIPGHQTIVTKVQQNYSIPSTAFCNCNPRRHLPNMGTILSTTIWVAPSLQFDVVSGDRVTFSVGVPTTLFLPAQPPSTLRGNIS